MAVQYDRDAEELVAEWASDLEAVLYQPEVEEAIREVSHSYSPPNSPPTYPPPFFSLPTSHLSPSPPPPPCLPLY